VPATEPVTMPLPEPIVALPLLLLQDPPVVVLARVTVSPWQTVVIPVMVAGVLLIVTVFVARHPSLSA
jgi:hypothetical protein